MSSDAITAEVLSSAKAPARRFLTWLLALTVLPLLFFPLLLGPLDESRAAKSAAYAIWLATFSHVGLTGWFWFIGEYRRHINARPVYFYLYPGALAVLFVGAVFILGPAAEGVFVAVFATWLFYHFSRQNWGVLCLSAGGLKCPPPSRAEWLALGIAPFAAVVPAMALSGEAGQGLRSFALAVLLGTAAVSVIAAARHLRAGAPLLHVAMTATSGLFFLPVFIYGPIGSATVAVAHGFQYALIMAAMAAADRGSGRRLMWAAPMVFTTGVYLVIWQVMTGPDWGGLVVPLAVAFQMLSVWHFIIDADLWRLRQPFQRQAVRKRLAFLFS